MITMDWPLLFQNAPSAKPGMTAIKGDDWPEHAVYPIISGDDLDIQLFGTGLRYDRYDDIIPSLPVRIVLTGIKVYCDNYTRKLRCRITTWDQNEEPVSFLGWLYLWSNYE